MIIEEFKNAPTVSLSDYLTPDKFRTITEQQREYELGVSEAPAEIRLKRRMRELLDFAIPWDGIIYACARDKRKMAEKLGAAGGIVTIYLDDQGDCFMLLFEFDDNSKPAVFRIETEDVVTLLENCWRVSEHQRPRVI